MLAAKVSWWAPRAWAVGLALVMLGPALGPGYVLSYDMVWVPDLALRPDFLGIGTGLPRAVPSDAVVAVLDEVVPGMLLQKVVLLACLVLGGWGAVHLAPRDSTVGALVAVSVYQWNPFVAERLLIGHWPVLLAYAVLPWVICDARRLRSHGRVPARLLLLVPLGSLSVSAGLTTAILLLAFGLRSSWQVQARVATLLLAANAPWLVSGLLHASEAITDVTGARVFALAPAGSLPAPLAALGLGGIWNLEVLLPSRAGARGVVWLVGLVILVAAGARGWRRSWPRRDVAGFALCWTIGLVAALVTWGLPDSTGWVMSHVPGAAVLRDGSRLLALCAPALTALSAHGAATLARMPRSKAARAGLGIAAMLFPLAVLPDAALGLAGRLGTATFPASYDRTRDAVASRQAAGLEGDVLLLPFTAYRRPGWNDERKVLDPLGRYLTGDFIANDELPVSSALIPGEDPRARRVAEILSIPGDLERSRRLAEAGIALVVVARDATASSPPVVGEVILDTPYTRVVELPHPRSTGVPDHWVWLMTPAWLLFCVAALAGPVVYARRMGRRMVRSRRASQARAA